MLPPKPTWFVVVEHLVCGHRWLIFARGKSEISCLARLASRAPDGYGISQATYVDTHVFFVPAAAA